MEKCSYIMIVLGSWAECHKRATYYEIDAEDGKTQYPLCNLHAQTSPYRTIPITDWEYGSGNSNFL